MRLSYEDQERVLPQERIDCLLYVLRRKLEEVGMAIKGCTVAGDLARGGFAQAACDMLPALASQLDVTSEWHDRMNEQVVQPQRAAEAAAKISDEQRAAITDGKELPF